MSCVRKHTQLKLDELRRDIDLCRVLLVCLMLATGVPELQSRIGWLGPMWSEEREEKDRGGPASESMMRFSVALTDRI